MKRDWEIPELQEYWTLQPGELNLLTSRNDENRLGFALLLKFFQIEGRFPASKSGHCRRADKSSCLSAFHGVAIRTT